MTNAWYNPHHQQDVPFTPYNPNAAELAPITAEPNVGAITQGCPCPTCSRAGYNYQTSQGTTEYQDPYAPVESIVPYVNQNRDVGGGYLYGIAATTGNQQQAWPTAPQAPEIQDNDGCAPLQGGVASSQFETQTGAVSSNQGQVLDMSLPERLRRLAERYVNDPESVVNGVYLEPGSGGRFQVVITVEIGDVLGDTIN